MSESRDEIAIDSLVASFFCIDPIEDFDPVDLDILDEDDAQALADLGDDLVDRIVSEESKGA